METTLNYSFYQVAMQVLYPTPHPPSSIAYNTELVQDPINKKCALLVQFFYCCFTKDTT